MALKFFGTKGFVWWKGVVENRNDPLFLGRVKVRIFGWHTENKQDQPTDLLPWAIPSLPIDNGRNPVGLKEGDWVWGFFLDDSHAQKPVIVGYIPGIAEDAAMPEMGFSDPTPDSELTEELQPRPPDMAPIPESDGVSGGSRFTDPDRLPGANIAFGQLTSHYDAKHYKWDVDGSGDYNQEDADQIISNSTTKKKFFDGAGATIGSVAISRYPLEGSKLITSKGEPITSRLARNENVVESIVTIKKDDLSAGEGAGHESSAVGTDESADALPFLEPETPYDAKYPFNHVYESESGHVTEIDDTPDHQRLHWYHRAGTFKEIHPDGTDVEKVKQAKFNFILDEYCLWTEKSVNLHATEAVRLKAGTVINNEADDLNRNAHRDLNALIGRNINTRVLENTFSLVEKESWNHVIEGTYLYVVDGVLHVVAAKEILIYSEKDEIYLKSPKSITLGAPVINLQGEDGGGCTINMVSADIRAIELFAHKAGSAPLGAGAEPAAPEPISPPANKAPEEFYDEIPEEVPSGFKPGFELPETSPVDDLWKPISEVTPKTLRTLSVTGHGHQIYEAIPTGELEAVTINYWNDIGQITTWEVVRPVHKLGRLIETGTARGSLEGGRKICQWLKKGGDYPKQVFWVVPGQAEPHLIQDGASRHQSFRGGFDNTIKGFNFAKSKNKSENEV